MGSVMCFKTYLQISHIFGCKTQDKTLDIAPGEACFPGANQPFS